MNIRNAKEILEDLRRISQIIVDLGYSAILQDNKDLAVEANILKRKINELSYEIRLSIIYASKGAWTTRQEIEQLASVLQVGVAAKEISDGVEDLIAIVLRGKGIHPILRSVFGRKYKMQLIKIPKDIKEFPTSHLNISEEIDIEYVRREDVIKFGPLGDSFKIKPEDILLLSGPPEKVETLTGEIFKNINGEK
jgi:uncharacterized protein with PhoU and TrkA domain